MTFDDLIRHYRFATNAARHLGVCRATIYVWRESGIPLDRQVMIERATKGQLMRGPRLPKKTTRGKPA